jgi:hypothetical protein
VARFRAPLRAPDPAARAELDAAMARLRGADGDHGPYDDHGDQGGTAPEREPARA